MKYSVLFLILLLEFMLLKPVESQNMYYGVTGGLTAGTPYAPPEDGASGKPGKGTMLGFFVNYKLSERFKIQSELFYSYKGASFVTPISGDTTVEQVIAGNTYYIPIPYTGKVTGTFGNQYFDLPILLTYKLTEKLYLLFGPQLSYLYKGKNKGTADLIIGTDPNYPYSTVTDEPFDQSDKINKWDYGIAGGMNYEANKRLNFNLKLTSGLRSIYKNSYTAPDGTVRNIYLQCSLDYRIGRIKSSTPTE